MSGSATRMTASEAKAGSPAVIGTASAAALVAANMIGAGAFTTSGFALADLGRPGPVVVAWIVGGAIALCGALSYAALAIRMPVGNGGEYWLLSRAVHPAVGFLAGWISLLAGFTAPIAVAAHGLEAYLSAALGTGSFEGRAGALAIVGCGLAHGFRIRAGLRLQNAAVAIKLVAIGLFIAFGAIALATAPSGAIASSESVTSGSIDAISPGAFAVTLVWISFAYSGWNAAIYVAGELETPARTLPRALVLATIGVTLLYAGLNAVFVYGAPFASLAGQAEVGAIAAEALGGEPARALLSAIVALGLLTSISAMLVVGPRVYAQMALDGAFPARLAPRGEVPRLAVALQVVLALVAFAVSELRELMLYVGFLLGLSASATVACLFLPSLTRSATAARGRGLLGLAAVFIVATLGSVGFSLWREPRQALAGGVTLVAGFGVYLAFTRSRGQAEGR